ncbi:GDP-mannose 4,6-dehydratase [Desulfallas thermosapovorans]|uniref:Nucleoside-diphosphate-sugar epimerase n=1 Tax=Desulfallas thermosapovorans DSM 6562 TaxID=1121431 RepID=A0A5S4ZWW0_9FIRM|nr:GDP-mannose 4,6-dehydratase [Desulfallas thermosapovorans]TYO96593.1 nucleoside-diphosphate-sugar epimerase [Desulfallas thermosapovorans DSM 6562]
MGGFTGRYIATELHANGYEVFGLVHRETRIDGTVSYPCDIDDQMCLTKLLVDIKPDVIVHLAGISFAAHDSIKEIYRVNLLGTLSLLKAIEDSKCCPYKIILASSAHVYGNQTQSPILESCVPAPVSDYAVSKLAMEHMARLWFDRMPIIVTRPFNYTGAGQASIFLPPKIVNHFVRRAPEIELGNLDVARDWSDVRDVARIYRCLLECPAHSLMVNICSGASYSLQHVLETMVMITGHTIEVRVNPDFVRPNEVKELRGDNSLLQSLIGEIPRRPLRETLAWMYEDELSLFRADAGETTL